jgi:hypothetical protein
METNSKLRRGGDYFGHKALIANVYGEVVSRTEWKARHTREVQGFVAQSGTRAYVNVAKTDEGDVCFRSSAFPQCP